MPLRESHGNMYPWVSHVHTHLAGECQHKCRYCYVGRTLRGRPDKYKGEPRILEKEFFVDYGRGRTIFIEHMNDLWGPKVDPDWICRILAHCKTYPDNLYIFQTKDPARAKNFLGLFPPKMLFGTTIETNRPIPLSQAPPPIARYGAMLYFKELSIFKLFITIEPIMDFDIYTFSKWLEEIAPAFINIGADSKGCDLPEPDPYKIKTLIYLLGKMGIEIRKKTNLGRLGIQGEHR
jgi:DNA repair photolyase